MKGVISMVIGYNIIDMNKNICLQDIPNQSCLTSNFFSFSIDLHSVSSFYFILKRQESNFFT